MAKRKAFRVLMVPEKGEPQETDEGRKFVRVHEIYAEDEAAARELASEQALAESQEHDRPLYVVKSVEAL